MRFFIVKNLLLSKALYSLQQVGEKYKKLVIGKETVIFFFFARVSDKNKCFPIQTMLTFPSLYISSSPGKHGDKMGSFRDSMKPQVQLDVVVPASDISTLDAFYSFLRINNILLCMHMR